MANAIEMRFDRREKIPKKMNKEHWHEMVGKRVQTFQNRMKFTFSHSHSHSHGHWSRSHKFAESTVLPVKSTESVVAVFFSFSFLLLSLDAHSFISLMSMLFH